MVAPRVQISLVDPGALGAPVSTDQIPIYAGVASQGGFGIRSFGRLESVQTEYGHGHLVDVAAHALASGASSVKLRRMPLATQGVAMPDGTAEELLIDSAAGEPLNFLRVRIEMVSGDGATPISSGTLLARYSLDAWEVPFTEPTYSAPFVVPADGLIAPQGIGITWTLNPAQTPQAGDATEFDVTPGHYDTAGVAAVTDDLRGPLAGEYTHLVWTGEPASAAAANTLAQAYGAQLSELFAEARFAAALAGAGLATDTEVISATAATAIDPPFLSLGYSAAYVSSPVALPGRGRLALRQHEVAAARISRSLISTDPGRTASGALRRVVGTDYDAAIEGPALHDARISVLRNWEPASQGMFIQRQRLLSSTVSNFRSWQHAAVMIQALRAAHRVAFLLVLELVRRSPAGTIDPRDAADIEEAMLAELGRVLISPLNIRGRPGHISAAGVHVFRTTPLPALDVEIKIRPLESLEDLRFVLQYADEVGA
jgi:hypothetical protein